MKRSRKGERVDRRFPLDVLTDADGAAVRVVRLIGELDMGSAPRLAQVLTQAIEEPSVTEVVLDLTDLRFIDAGGLRVLVAAYHRSAAQGRALRACHAHGEVGTVLWLTGVGELLNLPVGLDGDDTVSELTQPYRRPPTAPRATDDRRG